MRFERVFQDEGVVLDLILVGRDEGDRPFAGEGREPIEALQRLGQREFLAIPLAEGGEGERPAVEGLSEIRAGRHGLRPVPQLQRLLRAAPGPEPVHEDAGAIGFQGGFVGALDADHQITFPGLKIPWGSRARFILRSISIWYGSESARNASRFARPMPCSPLRVPPSSTLRRKRAITCASTCSGVASPASSRF